ncbi:MAG: hypothetical protein QOI64_2174 [Solirubrobacteraceae bacterium]|jgi:hypothetical protein|nr:hypothetical protein [Solirubrobacteraceae bacterium]
MRIDYDGRRFRPVGAAAVDGVVARYRQDGDLLRGEYSGGDARQGTLVGTCAPDGTLRFAYCHVGVGGAIVCGSCVSTPDLLTDGRVRLREQWVRYGEHAEQGVSWLEELAA